MSAKALVTADNATNIFFTKHLLLFDAVTERQIAFKGRICTSPYRFLWAVQHLSDPNSVIILR